MSKDQVDLKPKTVTLKHKETGQTRQFGLRYWSWEGFFSVIGLSQFLRGDYGRGIFHLVLFVGLSEMSLQGGNWMTAIPFIFFILAIMVVQGIGYNRFTVMKLLREGWVFEKPQSVEAREARKQWKLAESNGR